jgi:hypothetical protein
MQSITFLNRHLKTLTGAVHNHSEYSHDSSAKIDEILKAAKSNRLDFLTLNDHHNIFPESELNKALSRHKEKYNYKPLVMLGAELNDPNELHHLLIFDQPIPSEGKEIEEYLEIVQSREGVVIAAHPYEKRASSSYPIYSWTKLHLLEKVDGLEIWNFSSSWLSKLNVPKNGLFLYLFPITSIRRPFIESLKLWDDLSKRGFQKSAVGSTDAHSTEKKIGFLRLKILTHKYLFSTIRTNVLLDESELVNQTNVINALAKGNSYIVNYRVGYPHKFYAGIGNKEGEGVIFGEQIKGEQGL